MITKKKVLISIVDFADVKRVMSEMGRAMVVRSYGERDDTNNSN